MTVQVKCNNPYCRDNIEGICFKVFLDLKFVSSSKSKVSNQLICFNFEEKKTK